MLLLKVPHYPQRTQADCLAACAMMTLSYLGVKVQYQQLLRLLRVSDSGTSFYNLHHLHTLGVTVQIKDGYIELLDQCIQNNQPVIISVDTVDLPYWQQTSTLHALVVVGSDQKTIFVNDPAMKTAPQPVDRVWFELAWLRRDYLYATIVSG